MKKITPVLALIFIIFLSSCKKNNTPEVVLNEMADSTAMLNYTGMFASGPYGTVSGEAKILKTDSGNVLKLMSFSSSNGPDLRVYIAKEMYPVTFIDLGALKATGGNQVYSITGTVNFSEYKYALIHCRQYNHLFGWALLQ
ncbi:DM13 domain-containing protein [Ferruginibacter profundus]